MKLTLVDAFIVVTFGVAAVAGWRWTSGPSARRRNASEARPQIVVETMRPEFCSSETTTADAAHAGRVEFELEAGETLVGVTTAKVFPIVGPRVAVEQWDDVTTAQSRNGLSLRTWLARRSPSGPYAMLDGLWIDSPAGRTCRIGWSRFDGAALKYSNLIIHPTSGRHCRLEVSTADGQLVPGALVTLSPPVYQNGLASVSLCTDSTGAADVSGLGDLAWVAATPEGTGPDRTRVTAMIGKSSATVRLQTPLAGQWTFVESGVDLPLLGGSLRVTDIQGAKGPAGAWPVSMLVPAGLGIRRPWIWMLPRAATQTSGAVPATVTFRGMTPVLVEDAGRPFIIHATARGLTVRSRDRDAK